MCFIITRYKTHLVFELYHIIVDDINIMCIVFSEFRGRKIDLSISELMRLVYDKNFIVTCFWQILYVWFFSYVSFRISQSFCQVIFYYIIFKTMHNVSVLIRNKYFGNLSFHWSNMFHIYCLLEAEIHP